MSSIESLKVVIADDMPMDRHLLRFFLEEEGIQVVAEAARGAEAARLVAERHPDAIILHESLTVGDGVNALPLIRRTSPSTRIVILSAHPSEPTSLPSQGGDVYLKDGVGLKDLSFVLRTLCRSRSIAIDGLARVPAGPDPVQQTASPRQATPLEEPVSLEEYRAKKGAQPRQGRRLARVQAAAAACVLLLAFGISRTALDHLSSVARPSNPGAIVMQPAGDAQLQAALDRLNDLLGSMKQGSPEEISADAQALLAARAVALAAGADVTELDALIASAVPQLLPELPPPAARVVRHILGSLIQDAGQQNQPASQPGPGESPGAGPGDMHDNGSAPSPAPEPSPTESPPSSPSPTESPPPEPSPSPTDSPTPSPSPTDSPTPSPSPTDSPTPEPSPSPTDSPTPEPSPSPTESPTPSPTQSPSTVSSPPPSTANPGPAPSASGARAPRTAPGRWHPRHRARGQEPATTPISVEPPAPRSLPTPGP